MRKREKNIFLLCTFPCNTYALYNHHYRHESYHKGQVYYVRNKIYVSTTIVNVDYYKTLSFIIVQEVIF